MILFGDSICWGITTGSNTTSYLLQDMIQKNIGIETTNAAVSGACIAARTTNNASDICKRITEYDLSNYNYMILFAGTNDFGKNSPFGNINDAPANTNGNSFYSALKYIIEYAFTSNPTIEIAIVTPTYRNYHSSGGIGNAYTTIQNSRGKTLGDYSDALIEIANYYNIPVYDMRKNSCINNLNYASMLEEQSTGNGLYLHPKNQTYQIMNFKIINWLKTIL